MSRGAADLDIRYSLWDGIPDVYAGRSQIHAGAEHALTFFEDFVGAFDSVLAPVHVSIEDLDLYLDPRTCPPDFLPWLASWLGIALNERWPLTRRRRFVHRAAELFRLRGTLDGLRQAVELYTDATPSIVESGSISWSRVPLEPLEPNPPSVTIVVPREVAGQDVDRDLVEQIAWMTSPAHVALEIRYE